MDNCIDISHWQPNFDFEAFAKGGGKAVILKATEGFTYIDDTYEDSRASAEMAELAVSTYHFLRPGDMQAQARHYLTTVQPEPGERVVADHEDAEVSLDDLVDFLQVIHEMDETLQLTVYSGHLLKEQLGDDCHEWLAKHTSLWVAQYTSAAAPSWPKRTYKTWSLWQYTQGGTVAGFNGPVDCNRFNGSEEQMLAWFGPAGEAPVSASQVVAIETQGPMRITVNGKVVYDDLNS
jgi:lysozyme